MNLDGKSFVFSDKGKVIRAINSKAYDSANEVTPVVIEEIQVFSESQAAITNLRVVQGGQSEGPRLIVISNDEIQTISLRRCHSKSITTCSECVALQDPHCAWNAGTSRCVPVASVSPASAQSALIQSIPTGYSDQCPDNGTSLTPWFHFCLCFTLYFFLCSNYQGEREAFDDASSCCNQ